MNRQPAPIFFTDETIGRLTGDLQGICDDPEWSDFCDDIEQRLAMIREPSRRRLLKKLVEVGTQRGGSVSAWWSFLQAYFELAVGTILTSRGFELEYSPKLLNLTPDWSGRTPGPAGAAVLVEVTSLNLNDLGRRHCATISKFHQSLGRIKQRAVLGIRYLSQKKSIAVPDTVISEITAKVEEWLKSNPTPVSLDALPEPGPSENEAGEFVFPEANICIRYHGEHELYDGMYVQLGFDTSPAPRRSFEEKVIDKVRRYQQLLESAGSQFIVALHFDPFTKVSARDVRHAALRRSAPLFKLEKWGELLSGILLLDASPMHGQFGYELVANPWAKNGLPQEFCFKLPPIGN